MSCRESSHGVCSFCGQPLGANDDMVTKPGEKSETLRKMVVRTNHKHNVLTRNGTIFQENLMRESADADVIFAVSWLSCLRVFNSYAEFPTNITWSGLSWGVCTREILRVFRKKTSFSLVCKNVLHQVDKKALCSIRVLKSGWMSTSSIFPVCTAPRWLRPLWCCQAIWGWNVSKIMNTSWTGFLSQHRDHVDGFLFVQGGVLFLRQLPGSSHQSSRGLLQPHQIDPSIIHGETDMSQNTSSRSAVLRLSWTEQLSQFFDFHSLRNSHMTFNPLMIAHAILPKTQSCLF